MTDIATGLHMASDYLAGARFVPSEADEARDIAALVMADLPAELAARVERALHCDDHRAGAWALDGIANGLAAGRREGFAEIPAKPALDSIGAKVPRRRRKASISRQIAAAERGGKNVTSITTPDGVTLHFGKGESTEASNPWLDDLKVTKQ